MDLRKLDRRADWGSDETLSTDRADDVVHTVFNPATSPYRVYLVRSDEDFHRVIIGMNRGRMSLSSESSSIALRPEDLDVVGIRPVHTPRSGITKCRFANSLHDDIAASDGQLRDLCLRMFARGERALSISKGRTKLLIPKAEADGCLAVPDATACVVARCAEPIDAGAACGTLL